VGCPGEASVQVQAPTAGLMLQEQEGNECNAKETGLSGSWTSHKRWLWM